MRHLLAAALGLGASACNQPPVVVIVAPASGTTVTDRQPVLLALDVVDEDLALVELLVDGVAPPSFTVDPPLAPGAEVACDEGCLVDIGWGALDAREGERAITVVVTDSHGLTAEDTIAMTFEDTPTVTLGGPLEVNQVGVDTLEVVVDVQDRSQVTGVVLLDGVAQQGVTVAGDCRFGCSVRWQWKTAPLTGEHEVAVEVADPYGRHGTVTRTFRVGDVPFVTAIQITNTSDTGGFSDLDVEIHLKNSDTDAWLGCAGQVSGLEHVDDSNVHYDVMSWFVDDTGAMVPMSALAGRNLRLHVMEDDSYACPSHLDVATDDIVGTSAVMAAEQLATAGTLSFGDVVTLEVGAGRPF